MEKSCLGHMFHSAALFELLNKIYIWYYIFAIFLMLILQRTFFSDLVFNGEAYAPVVIARVSLQLTYESVMYLLGIYKCLLQNKLLFVQSGSVDFNVLKVRY